MIDPNLLFKQARKSWAEAGHPPDQFWHILPPLFAPYTTYGEPTEWPRPRTVREAVDQLILRSSIQTKSSVLGLEKNELGQLHFFFGTWIRNTFGLWEGNPPLFKAIRLWNESPQLPLIDDPNEVERLYAEKFGDADPSDHPDSLSGPIITAFWNELQVYKWPELAGDWENVRLEK